MKRIFAIVLTLCFTLMAYITFELLPNIYLNAGRKDYNKGAYGSAYNKLRFAMILSPKNRLIRYYYTETLINLKPTLEVQKALYYISQVNISDSANLISNKQITKWQNEIFSNIGENYIEKVPFDSKILRWDISKFPLTVYIQNNTPNINDYYIRAIKNAFLQWQKSSDNLVRFNFVDSSQNANILVTINPSTDMKKCKNEECKYTVAYTTPKINDSLLQKMNIFFYYSNNLGKPFTENEIYNTAIHEIGHALGIMGHSDNKDDIMYMETNPNKTYNSQILAKSISQTDLNTLNLLYKLIPDITNTPMNEFDQSHQFFSPIVIGNEVQITSNKILEAQNYINSAPDLPNGYIDLAGAYLNQKQYNNAVEALEKALSHCSNNNERFVVYYNLTVIYTEIKDWKTALKYAQNAKDLNTSNEIDGLIAMINYNLGNVEEAKELYKESLKKNPNNIINAHNLATLYIKEFNFIQAGRLLNKLVQVNPEAKNDPNIKAYRLLMFFFR